MASNLYSFNTSSRHADIEAVLISSIEGLDSYSMENKKIKESHIKGGKYYDYLTSLASFLAITA